MESNLLFIFSYREGYWRVCLKSKYSYLTATDSGLRLYNQRTGIGSFGENPASYVKSLRTVDFYRPVHLVTMDVLPTLKSFFLT